MRWRNAFLTIALCFGLGLGLAPAVGSAHACSCADGSGWRLMLEQITGVGDPTVEAAYWAADVTIYVDYYYGEDYSLQLQSNGYTSLELKRVQ